MMLNDYFSIKATALKKQINLLETLQLLLTVSSQVDKPSRTLKPLLMCTNVWLKCRPGDGSVRRTGEEEDQSNRDIESHRKEPVSL